MTNSHHDTYRASELATEREYISGLYLRLDAERTRVRTRHDAVLRSEVDRQNGGALVERDAQVRALSKEAKRLDVADHGLCFGRLDLVDGATSYVGRIGIYDESNEFEPLLLDWRAPAARPFYVATGAHPEGLRRRRQFHSRGRRLVDFTDEIFGAPDAVLDASSDASTDAALLAAVSAPRGEGMGDIVATIQAEQDRIIRLDHGGVAVIEGGPGTGKTVVALHRVAYLLYAQREHIEQHGVLVVGPNAAFLEHISRVLPSLGESDVVFTTPGGFVPGLHVHIDDEPEVAKVKGSLDILGVLAGAVADRQRIPTDPIDIELADVTVRIDGEIASWAREEAQASGRPHNAARAVFREIITWALTERAINRIGRGWLERSDRVAWEQLRTELTEELHENDTFTATLNDLWPILTPTVLLSELLSSRQRLEAVGAPLALLREDGLSWTVSDVALLDELTDLLGQDEDAKQRREQQKQREQRREKQYAANVLDQLASRADSMDDEDHLYATDLLYADDLAERFVERDTRELAERAAADRDWTYRHVVVDEAQELSAMDWRVLMRRCPSRSFTVVGDLAQRRSAAGASSWAEIFDQYVPGRWEYRSLTVNYRTPAEIMALAADVLAEYAPDTAPPKSVRASGVPSWARRVTSETLAGAIEEFVNDEAQRAGTSIVIGPPGTPGAVSPAQTKGMEFDAVLLVEPESILRGGVHGAADLYVALTRATQRLGVLHCQPLPDVLKRLVNGDFAD